MDDIKFFIMLAIPKVHFGLGASKKIGAEAALLGAKRCLVVTDRGVAGAGTLQGILESLQSAGVETEVFDKVEANPPVSMVHQGAEQAKRLDADLIVAVGGGSSMDTAKTIAILSTNGGTAYDYIGQHRVKRPILPLFAVPTTAGTGSEVSPGAVLQEPANRKKLVIWSERILPNIAFDDPELTVSMPPQVTADTGMDALTHALEAYVNVNFNPVADTLALESIRLVSENLAEAVHDGANLRARYNMLLSSMLAGIVVGDKFHGSAHAAAGPLVARYHISHGRACAIMLPHVMEWNAIACPDRFARVARALGQPVDGLPDDEGAALAVEAVRKLSKAIGIPQTLQEIGAHAEDIPAMAEVAGADFANTVNPRKTGAAEMELLYKKCLSA